MTAPTRSHLEDRLERLRKLEGLLARHVEDIHQVKSGIAELVQEWDAERSSDSPHPITADGPTAVLPQPPVAKAEQQTPRKEDEVATRTLIITPPTVHAGGLKMAATPRSPAGTQHSGSTHPKRRSWWKRFFTRYMKAEIDAAEQGHDLSMTGRAASQASIGILHPSIMIHPNSTFRNIWNAITNVNIFTFFFVLPVTLCFTEFNWLYPACLSIFCAVSLLGIAISCRTGFIHDGKLYMDSKTIFSKYAEKWLWFDLITAFPYFILYEWTFPSSTSLRWIALVNAMRLYKLITIKRPSWFDQFGKRLQNHYNWNSHFLRTFKVVFAMIMYWHWRSCLFDLSILATDDIANLDPAFQRYTLGFFYAGSEML